MPEEIQPDPIPDSNPIQPEAENPPEAAIPTPAASATAVESDEEDEPSRLLPYPIVAIGASKGGVSAYLEILRNLEDSTGMAFILIPHLEARRESLLPDVLRNATRMPVHEIEQGVRPQANHVYVLPPGMKATIQKGVFQLEPRPATEKTPMPIDLFFRALAVDQKNRAIGVILSGADSDGALGLKSIKGEGGIAIVQDPESAEVDEMPRSGILADHVDMVLRPSEIGSELSRLARQFFQPSLQLLEAGELAPTDEPHFARLLMLLRTVNGIEFGNYKAGTLRRRTARRLILRRIESLAEYVRFLHESREELRNLHEDVLINVTRFFRDPTVFEALQRDIFPFLLDNRPPDQQVRIWVAGCSTGEEAYSVAICLLEYLAGQPHEPPIQIFGTDASERSIEKARMGLYPESISKEITAERIRRYFVKTDKGYQIAKRVRDLCIFARQNLCSDPPFSRLDLITCRNVLIYLDRQTQSEIISTFHYALRPNGCLLVGRSESVTEGAGLFAAVDRNNKVYAKLFSSGTTHTLLTIRRPAIQESTTAAMASVIPARVTGLDLESQRAADRVILARHSPPGVVINEAMEILEVRGRPAPFLAVPMGIPTLHLLRIAHGDLMPLLRDAVRRAIDSGSPVVEDISVNIGAQAMQSTLEVLPIQAGSSRHYLVLFAPLPGNALSPAHEWATMPRLESILEGEDSERQLARLRRDLSTTRLYLQSLIEERDARNQELTATYEEIQSSNEELQSTNEELETAKEELQSTNEELQTVNDELRNRNHALLQASNDLSNLLNSVNIPVLILGSDLTIRQFTPPAERLMRLRPADIGRPIGEIRLNLAIDDIEPLLQEVLDTLATKELDVQDRSGRWHLLRLRPYRTSENKIDGVVLLLVDIDQMRRSREALQQARDFAQTVVEAVQVPVVVLDSELRVRTANAAFRAVSSLTTPDLDRRPFAELMSMLWDWPDLRASLSELLSQTAGAVLEVEHETSRTPRRNLRLVARTVFAESEPAVLIVLEDVTAQKQTERVLESDRERLAVQVRSTTEVLGRTREELRALAARLFHSQEEERRRIARELHDDVSQKLAILEIEIEKLRQGSPSEPETLRTGLENLRQRAAALANEVRGLSHQLHPAALDHFGLQAAMKTLVEEFGEREKMVVTFRANNVPEGIPSDVATVLYRVAQEALRNVAKHAGRTHVKVSLDGVEEGIRLTIRDLGEGFDMDGNSRRGLGLVSMEERARLVGGALQIESTLGEGTTVTVTAPLESK